MMRRNFLVLLFTLLLASPAQAAWTSIWTSNTSGSAVAAVNSIAKGAEAFLLVPGSAVVTDISAAQFEIRTGNAFMCYSSDVASATPTTGAIELLRVVGSGATTLTQMVLGTMTDVNPCLYQIPIGFYYLKITVDPGAMNGIVNASGNGSSD